MKGWKKGMPDIEKARKRDRKQSWTHFSFGGHVPFLKRKDGKTTACGKTAIRINATNIKNNVSCRRCIELLRDQAG